MHNNIMAAGSRDRPPMLATGRYAQWQSRFMRYIDTRPNGYALWKFILQDPYKLSIVIVPGQHTTNNSPEVSARTVVETLLNIFPENKAHYKLEKEAIHLLLIEIGDEIYSTLDACKTAHEMWIAYNKVNLLTFKMSRPICFGSLANLILEMESQWSHTTLAEKGVPLQAEQADWLEDTNEEIDEQELEAHYSFMAKIQEILPVDSGSDAEPLEKVQYDAEYNMFANERQHSEQLKSINDTHLMEKDDSNDIPDSSNMCDNDNQADQNAEACDDDIELEKYKTLNDRTLDYDKLERKLDETLGLLAQKEHDIKEGFKLKAYEISIVKEKQDELVKQSLLTKSSYEGLIKEKTKIEQLILFIVDSGCTKHMMGNIMLLCNFIEKYLGLNHNLFLFGQFCDANLEVAFCKSTCFVRDLQGNDLLTGNRGYDLYTISLQETSSKTPICFLAKALPNQAWLWHQILSHLNFDTINLLSKKDIVNGLPKLKYVKDQLCSSCKLGKTKRSTFKTKVVPSSKGRLNLLYMDLCGPMRIESIIGKKYILDETPEVLKDFLKMIQRNLQAQVITIRTDRGTQFLNKTLHAYFKEEGIKHQTSTP
ncbi:retrovirus-related pol polyprotein from transposon TNT 1-94 [Tanacetum coccineum]